MTENLFACPYLGGVVELSAERETHIAERHPDLWPKYRQRVRDTLAQPDEVRRSERMGGAKMLSRFFDDLLGGKHVVVVVITEAASERHWIAPAYIARRLSGGIKEWTRN